jgi:hypothetical protein
MTMKADPAIPRRLEAIAADFDALTTHDFENAPAAGLERLRILCDELLAINDPATCSSVMFRTMERLDGADLGSPGPLVHTLEKWRGRYEPLLMESVRRKPSWLAVWMVNRVLNTRPSDARMWLALLRRVTDHATASEATKELAAEFVRHQTGT